MHYPPRRNLADYDSGVVVDSHVYANGIVSRKLDDRVISHDREDENRLSVLDLNDG